MLDRAVGNYCISSCRELMKYRGEMKVGRYCDRIGRCSSCFGVALKAHCFFIRKYQGVPSYLPSYTTCPGILVG